MICVGNINQVLLKSRHQCQHTVSCFTSFSSLPITKQNKSACVRPDTQDTAQFMFWSTNTTWFDTRRNCSSCHWHLSQNWAPHQSRTGSSWGSKQLNQTLPVGSLAINRPSELTWQALYANVWLLRSAVGTDVTNPCSKEHICIVSEAAEQVGQHVWPLQITAAVPHIHTNQPRRLNSVQQFSQKKKRRNDRCVAASTTYLIRLYDT